MVRRLLPAAIAASREAVERACRKAVQVVRRRRVAHYLRNGRKPWTRGYGEYRQFLIQEALATPSLLAAFRLRFPLPPGYGRRLDARCVEIPFVASLLSENHRRLLDAGSSLNFEPFLTSPALARLQIVILSLAPEARSHTSLGVSYVYGDLRETIFKDATFDAIACISTLEHVGMNNAIYGGDESEYDRDAFRMAVREMRRVLRPGGRLLLTVPYGRYEDHGWFQQFDASRLDEAIDVFAPSHVDERIYAYTPAGWELSDRASTASCRFFDVRAAGFADGAVRYDPDYAAAERAVACVMLE